MTTDFGKEQDVLVAGVRQTVPHRRIRLGFLLIGDGDWRGGLNYQRTLLEAIAGPLASRVEARVFVTEAQRALADEVFGPVLEVSPVVDARADRAGIGRRAAKAVLTGRDPDLAAMLKESGVDVVFESARFFGRDFPIPALAWMPDFQHRHLPHLFTRSGWWKRDIGFRAQSGGRRLVMLSSEAARADCERFYPGTRGRTRVVHFAPRLPIAAVRARARSVRGDHGLPERFFYLPNQFWAHKNHALVLAALRKLRECGALESLPPVVMSGPTLDYRNAGVFEQLMGEAEADGLSPWFRHLGLIPSLDVFALNSVSQAVLNPSLFEGWASSVEEAKALGTPLILSDLPVHREQAPNARFFRPADPDQLAAELRAAAKGPNRQWADSDAMERANNERIDAFAAAFVGAILDAHGLRHAAT